MIDFFATRPPSALPEGHAHEPQQLTPFLVVLRGGDDRHVHAANLPDLVVVDLREDDLLGETHRVVAAAVERAWIDAPKVSDARHGHVDETVVELEHPGAAQR